VAELKEGGPALSVRWMLVEGVQFEFQTAVWFAREHVGGHASPWVIGTFRVLSIGRPFCRGDKQIVISADFQRAGHVSIAHAICFFWTIKQLRWSGYCNCVAFWLNLAAAAGRLPPTVSICGSDPR
jgi:hypothetical protein